MSNRRTHHCFTTKNPRTGKNDRKSLQTQKLLAMTHNETLSWKLHAQGTSEGTFEEVKYKAKSKKIEPNENRTKVREDIPQQPKVLLVGNSQIKNIDPVRLLKEVHVEKIIQYTTAAASKITSERIQRNSLEKTDIVVLHLDTNDVKNNSSNNCAQEIGDLTSTILNATQSESNIINSPHQRR